ncbi:MAG: efflux RND transporter permease subunit [Bacteroidota bacterium]
MRSIIKYFIQHPTVVNLCVILLVGLGAMRLFQTQVTNFPKQRIRFISVVVPYPGASPSEVEKGITIKVEENLEGIEGIDRVSSSSEENAARIQVELTENSDPDVLLAEVKNAIDKINNFPNRAESPIIEKVKIKDVAVTLGLQGDMPLSVLKDYAEEIKDDLLAKRDISTVVLDGLPDEEIAIQLRENDLLQYQLSFSEVANAVRQANLESFGGEIKTDERNITIKADNKGYYARELQQLIVKSAPDGQIVRLSDVADVRDQFAEVASGRYLKNQKIVAITAYTLNSEDILTVAKHALEYKDQFNQSHENVMLHVLEDGTINVKDRIQSMASNGLAGILLVLIVLALFLDRYLAFWVSLKIPIAIIGMFLLAGIQDMTINVVSLFGFILVLGILVDDGVVIGENIYQWAKDKGVPPMKAALEGTMEMLVPVVISLTTTAVAFSLFFFLPTQSGEFFGEMGFVVVAVLLIAMIESFFFLPAHLAHSKGLRADHKPSAVERLFDKVLTFLKDKLYLPIYQRLSIGSRWLSGLTVALFIGGLFGAFGLVGSGTVGFTFFPNLDDDSVFVELQMKPGTAVEVTQRQLATIEEAVWKVNEQFSEERTDGQQVIQFVEQITGPRPNQGKLKITFLGGEQRGVSSFDLSNAMRELSPEIPQAESLVFGIGATTAVFGKPVSFALFSRNIDELRQAKEELKEQMAQRTDLKDISDTDQLGIDEVHLQLKPKAELLGLRLGQIMAQVRAGFFGEEVQSLQRGADEVKVWVRYPRTGRQNLDQLMQMRINDGRGNSYLLSDLARVEKKKGTLAINHLEGRQEIRVEANVADISVAAPSVIAAIEATDLVNITEKYPSVSYSVEGQNRASFKMSGAIAVVGPIILLFIFGLIVLNFNSFSQAFIVFGLFPFATIGVILGHWIQGMALNIFSFVGTIALIGVFVNNSLVFISSLNQRLQEGEGWQSALLATAKTRFRPILLTTITTVAGLAPLIASNSLGAQFLKGPAVAIAYGLSFGLFNVLLLLPALLHLTNGLRQGLHRLRYRQRKAAAEVEPAVLSMRYLIKEENN